MYTLRVTMCIVLLCGGLQSVVPDTMPDGQLMASRDQKLQELLRSLSDYNKEAEHKLASRTTSTTTTTSSTPLSTPNFESLWQEHRDSRARSDFGGPRDNSVPDSSEIRSNQDFNRVFFSTQEGVNRFKKQFGPNGLQKARAMYPDVNRDIVNMKMANNHILRMRSNAKCQKPVPQVVRVKDYYPDPSREYYPRCTILHRCGDDTGCCEHDAFRCAPSHVQEVTLYFYSLTVGKVGFVDNRVEKLLFENHTACHCQQINDLPRLNDGRESTDEEESAPTSKCRECPVPFTSRVYNDGRCGCDCFDRQKPCIRIKRGREPLPDIERRCVEANHCHIPDCEYGLYDPRTGYCPRRHDEDQRIPHRRQYHGPSNHRWTFVERD